LKRRWLLTNGREHHEPEGYRRERNPTSVSDIGSPAPLIGTGSLARPSAELPQPVDSAAARAGIAPFGAVVRGLHSRQICGLRRLATWV
jgi:hypothetical protein